MAEATVGHYDNFTIHPISGLSEWRKNKSNEATMSAKAFFGKKRNDRTYEVEIDTVPGNRYHWTFEFTKGFNKITDSKEVSKVLSTLGEIVSNFASGPPMGDLGSSDVKSMAIILDNNSKRKPMLKKFYDELKVDNFDKELDEGRNDFLIDLEEK